VHRGGVGIFLLFLENGITNGFKNDITVVSPHHHRL
jgi:hypothetical protein